VHTHTDDKLPRRLTHGLDAFVDADKTRQTNMCQTVKVVGAAGEQYPQEKENMLVVLASFVVDRGVYNHCNSVHSRAEVLRCVLFALIDAGIVPVIRLNRTQTARQYLQSKRLAAGHIVETHKKLIKFLLAFMWFCINLPGALLVFCASFTPVCEGLVILYQDYSED